MTLRELMTERGLLPEGDPVDAPYLDEQLVEVAPDRWIGTREYLAGQRLNREAQRLLDRPKPLPYF